MDSGNTAWVLASCALVLFMTPGLAFFYGGMVRSKNVLGMLMQNFFSMGLVSVLWALVAFSLAFGDGGKFIGNFDFVGLSKIADEKFVLPGYVDSFALTIPPLVFCAFQLMFAIITPALITGAIADRVKFRGWVVFLGGWLLLVYAPVAHWVFSPTGWLFQEGALDFAGGTVVHINAGIAALAAVLVAGKRRGWPNETMPPHSLPLTLLGTGILWFGWFGFNAGSALGANNLAGQAFLNTNNAAAAAMIGWLVDREAQDRPRHHPGGGLRGGGRSGGHHPLRRVRRRAGPARHRLRRRGRVLPGHPAQVQARLRRLARRRRRPPRRGHHRLPHGRPLRRHGRELAGRRRPVLRWRRHAARQAAHGRRSHAWRGRS